MVTYYADPPSPDAWKKQQTWDETPVMPESFKPVSFLLNRALKPPKVINPPTAEPKPMTLPACNYIPPAVKEQDDYDKLIIMIDGHPHMDLDGELVELNYERHSGRLSKYPRVKPVPGLNKKPRGRPVPPKEERKGTTYSCRVCNKAFTRSDHMKRHVRSLHMHFETTYMCALPFCTKSFARRDNLLQHERKHKLYGAFFDCTTNFEGELIISEPIPPPTDIDISFFAIPNLDMEIPPPPSWANGPPLVGDDGLPVGERYRRMREEKAAAEKAAAEKAERERRKLDLERVLGPPPAIGTSRNMPLCKKPVFPTDFYYCGVVPS